MKDLKQLISEKEKELQSLENSLGLGFPIIEQAKSTRICYLQAELENLRTLDEQPELNENQQIVLEWLKEHYTYSDIGAIELIWRLKVNSTKEKYRYRDVYKSYRKMTNSEQLQILVVFAQWGLEQEAVNEK